MPSMINGMGFSLVKPPGRSVPAYRISLVVCIGACYWNHKVGIGSPLHLPNTEELLKAQEDPIGCFSNCHLPDMVPLKDIPWLRARHPERGGGPSCSPCPVHRPQCRH